MTSGSEEILLQPVLHTQPLDNVGVGVAAPHVRNPAEGVAETLPADSDLLGLVRRSDPLEIVVDGVK